MKNQINTLFLGLSMLGLTISSCSKEEDTNQNSQVEQVTFTDSKLEAAVKAALNLGADQQVNTENILALDTLDIDGEGDLSGNISGIANLKGLEAATNLLYLHFGATAVTDLSPISGLKKVKYLRLNDTKVSDLSPLNNYTSLIYFNANSAKEISNISALGNNIGLKEIILRDVPFGNAGMATIAKFVNLYRLNMRGTGVTDIQELVNLMSKGALLDSTPGANEAGGATLDLRGLTIDCSLIDSYKDQISNLDGC